MLNAGKEIRKLMKDEYGIHWFKYISHGKAKLEITERGTLTHIVGYVFAKGKMYNIFREIVLKQKTFLFAVEDWRDKMDVERFINWRNR